MGRFDDITVESDFIAVLGRNGEGRPLFRYSRWAMTFGVFRSHRMTPVEKELILLMMDKYYGGKNPDLEERKAEVLAFLNYEIDEDVFCS